MRFDESDAGFRHFDFPAIIQCEFIMSGGLIQNRLAHVLHFRSIGERDVVRAFASGEKDGASG